MAFNKWAFIYVGLGGEDPNIDRAVIENGGLATTVVAVPDPAMVGRVAKELVDAGAQSIELCGAFGPRGVTAALEATGGRVPVGGVTYGAESMHSLAALFPSSPE